MQIRKMTYDDLDEVARIHKSAYPDDHFSSRFSANMLKVYYSYVLKDNPYCFVAVTDERVSGFTLGGENTKSSVKKFLKENFTYMIKVLIFNPSFIVSRIKNYFKLHSQSQLVSAVKIRLLSIAVAPEAKGMGIATELIKKFAEEVIRDGFSEFGLSVSKKNVGAVSLYKKLGFELEMDELNAYYFVWKVNDKK